MPVRTVIIKGNTQCLPVTQESLQTPEEMGGCCICRPKTAVTRDPNVTLYSVVGVAATTRPGGSPLIVVSLNGLIYVKNGRLHHEATFGSRLVCRCMRQSWELSQIQQIRVIEGENVSVQNSANSNETRTIEMNPGLRIGLTEERVVVISMPYTTVEYAREFNVNMSQCVDKAAKRSSIR